MATRFPLSRRLRLRLDHVGVTREPVLLIDGLLERPEMLVDCAADATFTPAYGPAGGYPGLRAPAPLDYVEAVVRALTGPIGEAFALGAVRPARAECNFSLVTLPPDALAASQRAPHVDTVDPTQFAILHYLCAPRLGGTAFFRHRATGYEVLTDARLAAYDKARAAEPDGAGYVADGGRWFEQIGAVDAAFDRLVVYRSSLLHSGAIPLPEALTDDPRTGRLTANIFLTVRPAA